MKIGTMESGATRAPVKEENKGKDVIGRQIKAIAQSTSHTTSKITRDCPADFIGNITFYASSVET